MFNNLNNPNPFKHPKLDYVVNEIFQPRVDDSQLIEYFDSVYAFMKEMASHYEYSLCAVMLERKIQMGFLRALGETNKIPLLLFLQDQYGLTDDPIQRIAAQFRPRLLEDMKHARNKKELSSAIELMKEHFPPASLESNIFVSFNTELSTYLDYSLFQQLRFMTLYAQDPSIFKNQEKLLIRAIGLNLFAAKSQIKKVFRGIEQAKSEGIVPQDFSIAPLLQRAQSEQDWIRPRDSKFLNNVIKRGVTLEDPEFRSMDLTKIVKRLSERLSERKLAHSTSINYLKFVNAVFDAICPTMHKEVYQNLSHLMSRMKYSPLDNGEIILQVCDRILNTELLNDLEKAPARLHQMYHSNVFEPTIADPELQKALPAMFKEIAPNARDELKAYKLFGMDINRNKRLNLIKGCALSEELGL